MPHYTPSDAPPPQDSLWESCILYVDTTSNALMVGLSDQGKMHYKFREAVHSQRQHSSIVIPTIQQGLKQYDYTMEDIKALAINMGPGSFTGIRTGLATIRTMAQFMNVPIYAFNTFELLAAENTEEPRAVYIDALQRKAYYAALAFDQAGAPRYIHKPELVSVNESEPPADTGVICSSSLKGHFMSRHPHIIEQMNVFTPDSMLRLIQAFPTYFHRDWHNVLPMYLQEPNITIKPGLNKP
ncbi:MAG: tRNA (adenosine(37)-N6)-threonylcarbamoyltransferase complex dimerization subunit type 1 TsaB [Cyanobacteria bacterium]|nr:tRNA (adenosine(37)-N6)-threonylcarbamoyltransferase complex dimerization subunit type 1 TsaB [Cyanobacteriota bacterium]